MHLQPVFVLFSALLLSTDLASLLAKPVVAQDSQRSVRQSKPTQSPVTQILFKPSGGGKPPTTRGAGSRSDRQCPQDKPANPIDSAIQPLALTALVPHDHFGLTWADHPTFWVYLPKTSARQIVLSIHQSISQQHSQRFFPITGQAGIVGIPLAKSEPPLKIGQFYQWAVVLVCGDRPSPNDPFVTAWVQRVKPLQSQPQPQTTLGAAAFYGNRGIWYDALTTLATARRAQPENRELSKIWADFLIQPTVGLGAIANEPVR